jgi:hypothetical protein
MGRSILGASALDKTPDQVNTQAQSDDLKNILQKSIAKFRPQTAWNKDHTQTKNDAQHQMNGIGFLWDLKIFAHGLAPVVLGG